MSLSSNPWIGVYLYFTRFLQRLAMSSKKIALACFILLSVCGTAIAQEQDGQQVPTDFIRDVMQPLGVPIVTSFHAIRESIFLNTSIKNPHPVESLGNFFLAPSQYLFAGKNIILHEENAFPECEVTQAFCYDNLHWLKIVGSLIALPVGNLLGSAIKGIALLSEDVRERHNKIRTALKTPTVMSQLEKYRRKGITDLYSDEFIPCKGHLRPSQLTKKQKVEIEALQEIVALFEKHHIVYWIDCGTCLGAYRYGGIIPWDWDIDLSILMDDHDNVKRVLSTLDPEKYQIQDWSSYSNPKTFLKLYVKETKNFIDIYHYQINEAEKTVAYLFTYIDSPFPESWKKAELKCTKPLKIEEVFPLKQAKFDTVTVRAPNNVISFLQSKYGENLEPAKVWDEESRTYKRVENHPYYN